MKVDKSAEEALSQIHESHYYDRYINTDKTIHLIGLNFASKDRQLDSWKEEILNKAKQPTYLS